MEVRMSTREASLADDDKDNYVAWGLEEAERAANNGVGPGEVTLQSVSPQSHLGYIALGRAQLVSSGYKPGSEQFIG
jgi:hypothetical protein